MNEYPAGVASVVDLLFLQDSTSTTGAGKTGLAFNTAGLTCYYKRSNGTASVAVTLANIATLGTYVSGGFKAVDGANMPGCYEFHPPNAAFAAGAREVTFFFQGATGLVQRPIKYRIMGGLNVDDPIENAVWDALFTGNNHKANNTAGALLRTASGGGKVTILSGTAQAGSTANTIKLTATASAVNDVYNSAIVNITGGTGVGQTRSIVSYNGTTKVATVDSNWVTTPDNTSTFDVVASAGSEYADSGLAQAGGASTITLAATAGAIDGVYVDGIVSILSGTGADQWATITAYNGTTRVATVDSPWAVVPDATSAYAVTPSGAAAAPPSPGPTAAQIAAAVRDVSNASPAAGSLGAAVNAAGSGGGTVDANVISVNGTTFAGANAPAALDSTELDNIAARLLVNAANKIAISASGGVLLGETMPDGTTPMAHGGTPGSSTATLALRQIHTENSTGVAWIAKSTAADTDAVQFIAGTDWGSGLLLAGGGNIDLVTGQGAGLASAGSAGGGCGFAFFADGEDAPGGILRGATAAGIGLSEGLRIVSNSASPALRLWNGPGTGQALHLTNDPAVHPPAITTDVIDVDAGNGGHGATFAASGAGKHAIVLSGGAGAAADILGDLGGDVLGKLLGGGSGTIAGTGASVSVADILAAALARLFTTDSTKVYADAVAGSVVKEIAANAAGSGGGGGLDAAGVRAAVGLAAANLDTQLANRTGYLLAPAGLDAVAVEAGVNARQALAPILAASAGVISGQETGTVTIKGGNVTTTRIVAVTDASGNRTAVTLTLPS